MNIAQSCSFCCPTASAAVAYSQNRNATYTQYIWFPLDQVLIAPYGPTPIAEVDHGYKVSDVTWKSRIFDTGTSYFLCGGGCTEAFEVYNSEAEKKDVWTMSSSFGYTTGSGDYNIGYWSQSYDMTSSVGNPDCAGHSEFSSYAYFGGGGHSYYQVDSASVDSETFRHGTHTFLYNYSGWYSDCTQTVPAPIPQYATRQFTQSLSQSYNISDLYNDTTMQLSSSVTSSFIATVVQSYNTITKGINYITILNIGDSGYFSSTMREDRYYFRFNPQNVSSYQMKYYERFLPATGSSIKGYEIKNGGKFYSISVEQAGGYTRAAEVVPHFNSNGNIVKATVLYGGLGYVKATASLSLGNPDAVIQLFTLSGSVVSASVTSTGSYLPVFTFNKPSGGTAATASVYMGEYGNIVSMSFSNTGSGYTDDPVFTKSGSLIGNLSGSYFFNIGTEVEKTLTWNGQYPLPYTASYTASHPTFPAYSVEYSGSTYLTLPVPVQHGTTKLANIRYYV